MAKILHIITQSEWGGAQRYVFDLATGLKAEHEVLVACGGNGPLVDKLKAQGISVIRLNHLVRPLNPVRDLLAFFEIFFLAWHERPNIVHTNSSKAEILGNLAAWAAGVKKIIFTAHGFAFNEDAGVFRKAFFLYWEKVAAMFANRIICVSEFDRQSALARKLAPPEKLVVIHNGLEVRNELRNSLRNTDGRMIIGTVANLYPNKSLESFVAAAAELNKQFDNLEFRVAGDGSERKFLEGEIERHQLGNFKLLGFTADPQFALERFDIFVLTSTKEGFPYSILEAMAAGLPVVATAVGGVGEAVIDSETGYLVPAKDPKALAEKIAELIKQPELRERFGRSGRERVRAEFSSEKMLEATKSVIINKS